MPESPEVPSAAVTASAESIPAASPAAKPVSRLKEGRGPVIPALKEYPVGEELEYQISWLGVPVGLVTITVSETADADGLLKGLKKLSCVGRSNKYLETFYPVLIQLTSYVDPQTGSPRRFEASVKRRKRKHESSITFDPVQKTAFHKLPKKKSTTVPVSEKTQDGISLLYYSRTLPFRVGQEVPLEVTADGKNWHMTGRILRAGTVDLRGLQVWQAFEGQLQLAYPVPFFEGAKAFVWFSADEQRIPLLAKIKSAIGPVSVVLTRRGSSSSSNL